ncbi:guanylyl cyclase-activating protein 1-like isoform X1 [Lates japonicus]|nr:guanylyl cyclase-activating protein 1-like isoform X1 [Lates japonicus]
MHRREGQFYSSRRNVLCGCHIEEPLRLTQDTQSHCSLDVGRLDPPAAEACWPRCRRHGYSTFLIGFSLPRCSCRTAPMGNHGSNLDEILAEDMHHWYNKFMRESPSGLITLFELKAILNLKGMNENANSYVDQVFFTFDMDGDGYIDFVEYIAAISLMLKGEINQKLKWYFKLFDQDGNGKIDKEELETIFSAIQDITRNRDIDPEEIVSLIFERIDVKGEGELTLEEFIEGAKDHEDIMDMLKNLMDLTPVLVIIVEGRTG